MIIRLAAAAAALLFLVAASPLHNPGVTTADDPVVWTGTHTNTSQPCFLAFNSAQDANVTGNSTAATVDFDTEVFDQGADFSADTFTAPVTGRYLLTTNVRYSGLTAATGTHFLDIVTSNRTYRSVIGVGNGTIETGTLSVIADMEAADTVTVVLTVGGHGTDVVDIDASATILQTSFSGCLIS